MDRGSSTWRARHSRTAAVSLSASSFLPSDAMRALIITVAALFVFASDAAAQSPARPDLNGFWINQYTPDLAAALGKQPPFTEFGAERWRTVDTAKDPTAICLPVGPSRGFTAPFPFLLVQGPDHIGILFEYQSIWRAIYMDGRG